MTDEVRTLQERVAALEAQLRELDERNRELENEAAQRGVKLSCANIALSRAKIAFDEASRHREEMVQEVAHDLRTPLTSIKGAAQNLLDGTAGSLDEDTREYVEIIREHSERLIGVVQWLVGAMTVSSDPVEVTAQETDVGALAREVGRGLKPLAQDCGICLSVSVERQTAFVDAKKMRLVLENLVGNAIKFTDRGGEIEVTVVGDGDHVVLEVRDTGVGMDAEQQARIFERYYRSESDQGGTGLGLAICREVARVHGGDISVTSAPGEGSKFTVRIPRRSAELSAWALEGSS